MIKQINPNDYHDAKVIAIDFSKWILDKLRILVFVPFPPEVKKFYIFSFYKIYNFNNDWSIAGIYESYPEVYIHTKDSKELKTLKKEIKKHCTMYPESDRNSDEVYHIIFESTNYYNEKGFNILCGSYDVTPVNNIDDLKSWEKIVLVDALWDDLITKNIYVDTFIPAGDENDDENL